MMEHVEAGLILTENERAWLDFLRIIAMGHDPGHHLAPCAAAAACLRAPKGVAADRQDGDLEAGEEWLHCRSSPDPMTLLPRYDDGTYVRDLTIPMAEAGFRALTRHP